jgi:hypothetical protein
MECRRDIWPRRRPEAGVGEAVALSIEILPTKTPVMPSGALHCHYAANLGMGFSSTHKNRELRVPATRQQALENTPFSRVFVVRILVRNLSRGSVVEAAEGKSWREIDGVGRDLMTQL